MLHRIAFQQYVLPLQFPEVQCYCQFLHQQLLNEMTSFVVMITMAACLLTCLGLTSFNDRAVSMKPLLNDILCYIQLYNMCIDKNYRSVL